MSDENRTLHSTHARLRELFDRVALPCVLFAGVAVAGLTPVADGDVYWHLAAGREIVRRHGLLYTDPFSVSAAGQPWIDVHWLFQLGVYALHGADRLWLLVVTKCALVGAGALLLYAAVPRGARRLFVICCLAAMFAVRHLLLVRPVIVSLLLLACFFYALEHFRRNGRPAVLAPLPALQVLWSNCQGLSALGPALVLAYAIGALAWLALGKRASRVFAPENAAGTTVLAHARALGALLALCAAASFATPYGLRGFTLPGHLLGRLLPSAGNPYANVAENVPPLALDPGVASQFWHLAWFVGALVLSFAVSRRIVLSQLSLVLGFLTLALISNRNVLLFYWIASPVMASQFAGAARRVQFAWKRHRAATIARAVSRAMLAGQLALVATAAAREPNISEPVPFRFPITSVAQIAERGGQGALFCADQQGGYVMWALHPHWKPYLDTRLVLRTPAQFSEYLALADEPTRFGPFASKYGFSYAVLPVGYPDRYLGLIAYLYRSPDWQLVFTDGTEVLFARREQAARGWDLSDASTTDRVLAGIHRQYSDSPKLRDAALQQFATLDIALGEAPQAERVLRDSRSHAAVALRARISLAAGDLDAAQAAAEARARADASDVRNLVLMAMVYARRGRLQQSLDQLRRALKIDPYDAEALGLLADLEARQYAH